MDLEPEDTFISLTTLEKYIEKYPEDAEKWREFLDMKDETHMGPRDHIYSRAPGEPPTAELLEPHVNIITPTTESPVEHYKDGCLLCKKTWASTDGVPTTTLICGHAYHTICYMYKYYAYDAHTSFAPLEWTQHDKFFQDCELETSHLKSVMLYNSKFPDWFKIMSSNDILNSNFMISKILRKNL
jgi:hypothetical protein